MAKFASASRQAESVIKALSDSGAVKSLGTARNYAQALTRVGEWVKEEKIHSLRSLTLEQAHHYLAMRGQEVGQKTLDMERQAIQSMFTHLTGQLNEGEKIRAKSELEQVLKGRAYTTDQAKYIADHQKGGNQLATQIAHSSGLRAHELLTLRTVDERAADPRPSLDTKWQGREGQLYTVTGKGGLTREVMIPSHLAAELEKMRLAEPVGIKDREIWYQTHYSLAGGKNWSSSFSSASSRLLGWSTGAHGLRHSYAQERMAELQAAGLTRAASLETVSQEMGHFRPEITEAYLR